MVNPPFGVYSLLWATSSVTASGSKQKSMVNPETPFESVFSPRSTLKTSPAEAEEVLLSSVISLRCDAEVTVTADVRVSIAAAADIARLWKRLFIVISLVSLQN